MVGLSDLIIVTVGVDGRVGHGQGLLDGGVVAVHHGDGDVGAGGPNV